MNRWPILLVAALAAANAAPAETIGDDLYRLPSSVNAMAVVNMDAVFQSPRAKSENWAKRPRGAALAGCLPIDPRLDRIVIGAHFDPFGTSPPWSVALANLGLKQTITLEQIAQMRKGTVEEVAGQPAAITPHGYFALVQPGLIAATNGTSRVDFAKYLRFAKDNQQRVLAPYLVNAVKDEFRTPIVLAFDTEDMIDPKAVARVAAASKALGGDKATIDAVVAFVGKLKGIRIFIQIGESGLKATVTLDGPGAYTGDPNALKAFLLEALGRAGANLDILSQAVPKPAATGISYVTDMPDTGLMRLMTLLHVPPAPEAPPPPDRSPEIARDARIAATQHYYNAIVAMLTDLNAEYKRANSYSATANWHAGYAQRIEQLPTVDVDQTVLSWGEAVAFDLRALAASLRGVPIHLQQLESQKRVWLSGLGNSGWGWGGRPMVYLGTNEGQVAAEQQKAIEAGRTNRDQVWTQLTSEREQVRQKFQDQYGVDLAK